MIAGKIIRLVRVMRIMRIFKLVRHFAGLQSLIYTLNQAYKELGLLLLLIAVSLLTVSYLQLTKHTELKVGEWSRLPRWPILLRKRPPSGHSLTVSGIHYIYSLFYNQLSLIILITIYHYYFWYSLMTLTTVGYELHPKSTAGKV